MRQLHEKFLDGIMESSDSDNPTSETSAAISKQVVFDWIGVLSIHIDDTIIEDICGMIEKGYRHNLKGYVLCLSRIMNSEKAWGCIKEAFVRKSEPVPKDYLALFQNKFPPDKQN